MRTAFAFFLAGSLLLVGCDEDCATLAKIREGRATLEADVSRAISTPGNWVGLCDAAAEHWDFALEQASSFLEKLGQTYFRSRKYVCLKGHYEYRYSCDPRAPHDPSFCFSEHVFICEQKGVIEREHPGYNEAKALAVNLKDARDALLSGCRSLHGGRDAEGMALLAVAREKLAEARGFGEWASRYRGCNLQEDGRGD